MSWLGLSRALVALIVISSSSVLCAQTGQWSSTSGPLRLHAFDDFVVGDFGRNGVLIAKRHGDCLGGYVLGRGTATRINLSLAQNVLRGTLTNSGYPARRFQAERVNGQAKTFTNFSRTGATFKTFDNERTVFDGSYDSMFGQVNLKVRDLFLVGDYGDSGVVVGMWDGNSFQGRFLNDDGKIGWFDFEFFSRTGDFRAGRWGWFSSGPQTWNLTRRTTGTPEITGASAGTNCAKATDTGAFSRPNGSDLSFRDLGVLLHHTRIPFKTTPAEFVANVKADRNWTGARIDVAMTRMATSLGTYVGRREAPIDVVMSVITPINTAGSTCVVSYRGTDREHEYQDNLEGMVKEDAIPRSIDAATMTGLGRSCLVKKGYLTNYQESRERVMQFLDSATRNGECSRGLHIIGMSLGGATANLIYTDLMITKTSPQPQPIEDLVAARKIWLTTAGAPRSLTAACASALENIARQNVKRFIYGDYNRDKRAGTKSDECLRYTDPVPGNPYIVLHNRQLVTMSHFGHAITGYNTIPGGHNPSTPALNQRQMQACNHFPGCQAKRVSNAIARVATRTALFRFPSAPTFPTIGRDAGASCSAPGLIPWRSYAFGRQHDTCSYRNLMAAYGQQHNGEPAQTNHVCPLPNDPDDPSNFPFATCPLGPDGILNSAPSCLGGFLSVRQYHAP